MRLLNSFKRIFVVSHLEACDCLTIISILTLGFEFLCKSEVFDSIVIITKFLVNNGVIVKQRIVNWDLSNAIPKVIKCTFKVNFTTSSG